MRDPLPLGLRDLLPIPSYRLVSERIDHPEHESEAALRRTLKDLWLVNRISGGFVVIEHLKHLTRGWSKGRKLRILDLATGMADIPLQVVRWASKRGLDVEVVATDVSPQVLEVARGYLNNHPHVKLEIQDAQRLLYPDKSFDVVICSLALHHFERSAAVVVLGEMSRLARVGLIANDMERCLGAWALTRVAMLTPLAGEMTRHDGPASVARSFTARELLQMAREAGLSSARVHRHALFRQALVDGPRL